MQPTITWKAVYENNEELPQFDENGKENKYTDIDRGRLKTFEILKNNKPVFCLHLDKGRRLIFRRRVAKSLLSGEERVVYLVGWQQTIREPGNPKDVNTQDIAYIFEDDGHIELAGEWQNTRWFYAPNLIEQEREEYYEKIEE